MTRTPPTAIVNESLVLRRGDRIVEILHLGAGDTAGDLVVYLPREHIVCTGDMVTEPIPFGFSRFPLEWRHTLERLVELDFDTLVPGHGDVQQGKACVRRLVHLLRTVEEQVREGTALGLDLEGIRRKADLSQFEREFAGENPVYRYYFQQYFEEPNVQRTFDEVGPQQQEKSTPGAE